jgi:hypothetical protein
MDFFPTFRLTNMKKLNISKDLKPQYFWDVDIDKLDVDRSKRLIIERVFGLGTAEEIMHIRNYYGTRVVINVLQRLNYMDPKTLNFVSKLFNVSLQSFKCYTRKQSNIQHWSS